MTAERFRKLYPLFTEQDYSTEIVDIFIDLSANFFSENKWGDLLERGVGLWVAHYLYLDKQMQSKQGVIEASTGVLNSISKNVGSLSKSNSYDVAASLVGGEGQYAETLWGKQYWQLVQMIGAGVGYAF